MRSVIDYYLMRNKEIGCSITIYINQYGYYLMTIDLKESVRKDQEYLVIDYEKLLIGTTTT